MLQAHLVLRGNAYNQILTDRKGQITELLPMHPDRVKIEQLAAGAYRYQFLQSDGAWKPLTRGEVWHLRGMSFDGITGLSPIELARDAVGMGLSAQEYGARFFQNDARPGGVIEFNGTFKDQAARQTFIQSWQAGQAGASRGKTAVLEHDMKYKEIGLNNADAQFIEARKFQVNEIARLFRIPPHMIADLDRATFSNIEHQSLEFVLHTMTPHAERWESSIEANLLTEAEGDLEIEFDFASLLRGDHKARAEYYGSGITNGWMTRNEARRMEGYDPIPGLDVPLQQLNMSTAGSNPLNNAPQKEETGPIPPDARHAALVHGIAARLARRAAGALKKAPASEVFDGAFALVVAEAMAVPIMEAHRFCDSAQLRIDPNAAVSDIEGCLTAWLCEIGK
jgi:HK97 family phage portal protein